MTTDIASKPVNIPTSLAQLFTTELHRSELGHPDFDPLLKDLEYACRKMARDHKAGQEWSERNVVFGYTSYGTIRNLATYAPVFGELKTLIDREVEYYAESVDMDLGGKSLVMQESWINVLKSNGGHSSHIHAQSVISGTFYVSVPDNAGVIQFEDPRLAMMMHSPPRRAKTRQDRQVIVGVTPIRGTLLLWESWLRHAVETNRSTEDRISISFNYDLV